MVRGGGVGNQLSTFEAESKSAKNLKKYSRGFAEKFSHDFIPTWSISGQL